MDSIGRHSTRGRHRNDDGLSSFPKSVAGLFWLRSALLNPGNFVSCSCRCGFQSCRTPFASSCCPTPFATQRRFLARVLHALRPRNNSWPVTHLKHCVRRNQVQIEHLVAGRAEQDKIADVVVVAVTIKVSDLQNVGNSEAAMRAEQPVAVVLECKLAVVDAFHVPGRRAFGKPDSIKDKSGT